MNREDIIRMARETCETTNWKPGLGNEHVVEFMARFAALVAAAEREACAKFCEENQVFRGPKGIVGFLPFHKETLGKHEGMDYADAIRSRGEVKP